MNLDVMTEAFGTTCAVQSYRRLWGAGGCPAVVAQWQAQARGVLGSTPGNC